MFSVASVMFMACSKQEVTLQSSTISSVRTINKSTGVAMVNINLPADLRSDPTYNGYVQDIDFRVDYRVSGNPTTKEGFIKVRLDDYDKIVSMQLSKTLLTDSGLDEDFIIDDVNDVQTLMRGGLAGCLRDNREAYNYHHDRDAFLNGRRSCWDNFWNGPGTALMAAVTIIIMAII